MTKLTQHPRTCGIDRLRLYLAKEELNDEFVKTHLDPQGESSRVKDLRTQNLPFVLIRPKKSYGSRAPLILDFQEVWRLSAEDILEALKQVVAGSALNVRVGAVDFTSDWIEGTVALCHRCICVRSKRKRTSYANPNRVGGYETVRCDSGATETLYFGSQKSSDFYRFYDKAAQLRKCHQIEVPGEWTRLERHLSGRSLPRELRTLRGLLYLGPAFSPFSNLEVTPNSTVSFCDFMSWSGKPNDRRNVFWTHTLISEVGIAEAKKLLRHEGRDVKRELDLLKRALTQIGASIPVFPDFNAVYQSAFYRQIWPYGVDPKASLSAVLITTM